MSAISEGVMHMDEPMAFLMQDNLYDLLLPHENELARTASRARQT